MRTIDELKQITPSEMLKDAIKKSGKSLTTIGRALGLPKQNISNLMNGHRNISAQMSYDLEHSIGSGYINGEELYLCQCLHIYEKIIQFNEKEESWNQNQ